MGSPLRRSVDVPLEEPLRACSFWGHQEASKLLLQSWHFVTTEIFHSNLHTFNDSANSLEKAAFILKDAMLVDDFYPTSNRSEQQQMISTFEKLA